MNWIGLILLGLAFSAWAKGPQSGPADVEPLAFRDMDYPYQERNFTFQGHQVVYLDQGSGDALVFLHGQASDLLIFHSTYPLFDQNYRVVALDYPGFGKSDKPRIHFSEAYLVELLDQLFTVAGIDSATLIGHSYGGYVAMVYAVARPERVRSLVLISTAGIQQYAPQVQRLMRESFTVETILNTSVEQAFQNYRHSSVNWTAEMEHYARRRAGLLAKGGAAYRGYAHAMVEAMELMLNTTVRDRIGAAAITTLIIWGRNDPLIPHAIARETIDCIPQARLVTIENCGHFVMLEYPQRTYQEIEAFLQRQQ